MPSTGRRWKWLSRRERNSPECSPRISTSACPRCSAGIKATAGCDARRTCRGPCSVASQKLTSVLAALSRQWRVNRQPCICSLNLQSLLFPHPASSPAPTMCLPPICRLWSGLPIWAIPQPAGHSGITSKSRIPMRLCSLAFPRMRAHDQVHSLGCRLRSPIAQLIEPVAQAWYCCIVRDVRQEAAWLAGSGASGLPLLFDPRFDTKY